MSLLVKIKALVTQTAVNTGWLQRQDERLQRLEQDLQAMQHEVERQRQYERSRLRREPQ